MCVDYKKLSDITVKNKYPIPIVEDLLDELHGEKFFSKLDLHRDTIKFARERDMSLKLRLEHTTGFESSRSCLWGKLMP